jgi:PAS domain S-box-containing protein
MPRTSENEPDGMTLEQFRRQAKSLAQANARSAEMLARLEDQARALAEANVRSAEMLERLEELNKELKRAKEKAETYLNLVSTIVVALDRRGNVAQLNRKGLEILGCNESELLGKNWFETSLPAAQRAAARAAFEQLLSPDGVPESDYESGVVTRSAADRTIAWHYIALRDEAGHVIGALGSGEDVTERKRAQQAIEEINERLEKLVQARTAELSRANDLLQVEVNQRKQSEEAVRRNQEETERILDSIRAGVMVLDARDHTILYANPFALQMFDRPRDEILGQLCHGFVYPAELGKCPITDLGQKVDESERKLIRRDGSHVPILKTVTQVIRSGRECLIESFLDLTQRKQAEEELAKHRQHLEELVEERTRELRAAQDELVRRERLAALGQVAGSIAHELRNPLGVINNAAYYLKLVLAKDLPEKAARNLAQIEEQVERSNRIITSLLDFARGRPAQRTDCRLADVVMRAVEQACLPSLVRVSPDIPDSLPRIHVDDGQISQVFVNLLTNAGQAMAGQGEVKIAAELKEQAVEPQVAVGGRRIAVSVTDSGPGIKPEDLNRVFEPLFSTKTVGIGLGLPICKAFVEGNGGTIAVESEPGKGATFTVTLPAL